MEQFHLSNKLNFNNNIEYTLNQRELMLKAAINRFKNSENKDIVEEICKQIYLPLIPIKLKWNINLN
jgi:hypothetical protein